MYHDSNTQAYNILVSRARSLAGKLLARETNNIPTYMQSLFMLGELVPAWVSKCLT